MVERAALVVDTETLGKEHDAGLCDIAIVAMDGAVLLNSYVNPGKPIPADASRVHGISDRDVVHAPMFSTLYPTVASILSGRVVIAYNSDFDAGCMNALSRLAALPEIAHDWECSMLAYAEWAGVAGRFGGYRWHRLGDAAAAMGIANPGAHRALADAETTRRLVLAMAASTTKEDRPLRQELLPGMRRTQWE